MLCSYLGQFDRAYKHRPERNQRTSTKEGPGLAFLQDSSLLLQLAQRVMGKPLIFRVSLELYQTARHPRALPGLLGDLQAWTGQQPEKHTGQMGNALKIAQQAPTKWIIYRRKAEAAE